MSTYFRTIQNDIFVSKNKIEMNKKLSTEFDICLSLTRCFYELNRIFKNNGLDIKLKVESHIIPDNLHEEENHDRDIPLRQ